MAYHGRAICANNARVMNGAAAAAAAAALMYFETLMQLQERERERDTGASLLTKC